MKRVLLLVPLAACVVGGAPPPVSGGDGIRIDDETGRISVDSTAIPVVPTCAKGQIVGRGANGWECFTPATLQALTAGNGVTIENGTVEATFGTGATDVARGNHDHDGRYRKASDSVPWNEVSAVPNFLEPGDVHEYSDDEARAAVTWSSVKTTVPASDIWPGTITYAQVLGAPAEATWTTVQPTVANGTEWPGTIPYARVSGTPAAATWPTIQPSVTSTSDWPGTIPYSRVSNAPEAYTDAKARTAVTWSSVASSVTSSTDWPGSVPYARVSNAPAPYTDAEAQAAVTWSTVAPSVASSAQWPGKVPYAQVTNPPDVDALTARIAALEARLAMTDGDCPPGYTQDASATGIVLCRNGADEMIKVGTGITAFWIDRYEASVWSTFAASGTQYGANADDYPATFPDNGQWTAPVYAVSKVGVQPSRNLTWFQAAEACRAAGKRMPTREEWLAAARGTPDPGANNGLANTSCNTSASASRVAGGGTGCASAAGAQDMVGNSWEWVDEWYAGLGNTTPFATHPTGFAADGMWNVTSSVYRAAATLQAGMPAAAIRGGGWGDGTASGVFAVAMNEGPTSTEVWITLRCVIPRAAGGAPAELAVASAQSPLATGPTSTFRNSWVSGNVSVTIPQTGRYLVNASCRLLDTSAQDNFWSCRVLQGSTSTERLRLLGNGARVSSGGAFGDQTSSGSFVATFAQGETLRIQYYVNGTGTNAFMMDGNVDGQSGITVLRVGN